MRVRGSKNQARRRGRASILQVRLSSNLIEFHSQWKNTIRDMTEVIRIPEVTEEALAIKIANVQAITIILAQCVRTYPMRIERCLLDCPFEMRKDETTKHSRRTKVRQMMIGQTVLLAGIREELHLLLHILVSTPLNQTRNEKDMARCGRLVILQLPVLKVVERSEARTSQWRMLFQCKTFADLPEYRAAVVEVVRKLAPFDCGSVQLVRHIFVSNGNEVGFGHELCHVLLEVLRITHQDSKLQIAEATEEVRGRYEVRTGFHCLIYLSPKQG